MAITKERKDELVAQYTEWAKRSEAFFLTEYTGINMKQLDDLRAKVRESGGEFHIIKNTLGRVAFESLGMKVPEKLLEGSTAAVFAFKNTPALAKTISDYTRSTEFVKLKGGYLSRRPISVEDVKSLADLPPLPVVRAQLLGVLSAPASKLVRTLAEPARSLASVFKSYADKDAAPAA